ncbi:MAG: universal stress protein UspE [Kangiellaceae bacterium]|jgi:universal stress protein E|nr:universal stress protein UspE [Kangiellaceae bacterium]
MQTPENLLVVINGAERSYAALSRAVKFADIKPVTITLISAVYEPILELTSILAPEERDQLKKHYLAERTNAIEKLKTKYETDNIKINLHVVWYKKLQQLVVDYCNEHSVDLVIKRIGGDAGSSNPFVMPCDWYLLRFCKSPLLLINDEKWQENSPILAAVSAESSESDDQEHRQLDDKILDYSHMLASIFNGQAHVIHSHINPVLDINFDSPTTIVPDDFRHQVTQHFADRMQKLMSKHAFNEQHIHIVEGVAEEKIPATAESINAQLVVLGTVGRSGLTAAFMGNTAERVLAHLTCEVLALKPDGFDI